MVRTKTVAELREAVERSRLVAERPANYPVPIGRVVEAIMMELELGVSSPPKHGPRVASRDRQFSGDALHDIGPALRLQQGH